jgi:hypothetical protein
MPFLFLIKFYRGMKISILLKVNSHLKERRRKGSRPDVGESGRSAVSKRRDIPCRKRRLQREGQGELA